MSHKTNRETVSERSFDGYRLVRKGWALKGSRQGALRYVVEAYDGDVKVATFPSYAAAERRIRRGRAFLGALFLIVGVSS